MRKGERERIWLEHTETRSLQVKIQAVSTRVRGGGKGDQRQDRFLILCR